MKLQRLRLAVTLAWPISFIRLLVPQLARRPMGGDLRRVLAGCVLRGPALLQGAGVNARIGFLPDQIATGAVTGALGAPDFIAIVARGDDDPMTNGWLSPHGNGGRFCLAWPAV